MRVAHWITPEISSSVIMASHLYIPIPCVSVNKNTCTWSMVPMSNLRASRSMHGVVEPKLQRWLGGRHGLGIEKRGDAWRVRSEDWSCGIPPPRYPLSTQETIKQFYSSINEKDRGHLGRLLTEDCQFNDLVFYIPFQHKQGVLDFLGQLMDAMGQHIKIVTEKISEGERYSASVTWHLGGPGSGSLGVIQTFLSAWKGHQIPFTSGCNFFECETGGENLLIKNIRGVEEFPIKPGDFALKLLKMTATFFDQFPLAAELLLKSEDKKEGVVLMILHLLSNDKHSSS